MEIKRQIWLIDEGLFRDKVFPLLNQHIGETHEFASENPLPPTKRRESDVVLQELVHLVGKLVALYNMLLHFFRTLLVSTHNTGFCALRADLLMALHDVGVSEIYHLDPCHKFAWCLDACVRDGAVELRRIKEMQFYFSSVPPADPILGDLAMIVANPHATNTLIRSIFTTLVDVVNRESIPKDDDALVYMSDLLTLGLNAEAMLRDQVFQTMKTEKEILQNFYPLLAFRILDDAARTPDAGMDLRATQPRPLPPAEPLDDTLITLMQRHPLARRVMMYYVLTRVAARDAPSVELLLATLTKSTHTSTPTSATLPPLVIPADEPAFMQSLVSYVLSVRDPRITHVVIDTFMLSHKADAAHIHKQLVRFLVESQTRLNPRDLVCLSFPFFPLPPTPFSSSHNVADAVHHQNPREQCINGTRARDGTSPVDGGAALPHPCRALPHCSQGRQLKAHREDRSPPLSVSGYHHVSLIGSSPSFPVTSSSLPSAVYAVLLVNFLH